MVFSMVRIGVVLALACLARAQELTVSGSPEHSMKVTAADMAKMPRTLITVTEHGKERKYEGVLLRDILAKAGAPLGDKLKGQNMPAFVYLTAHDGYHVVLALAEVEPAIQDNRILVADTAGGAPLAAEQGPFRLIVPEDLKPARWIRMLEKIEVRIPDAAH
jgi:DMSO/TMAO reductase YedYZ molybdopterin-dependent catalytic subunit